MPQNQPKLSVCHVISRLERGGAENHIRILAKELTEFVPEVNVIVLNSLDHSFRDTFPKNVNLYDLSKMGLVKKLIKIYKLSGKDGCNILHSHLPIAELLVALMPNRHNVRKVTTRHVVGNYVHRFERNWFLYLSKLALRRIKNIIVISKAVKFSLIEIEKVQRLNIALIYYGFDSKSWLDTIQHGDSIIPKKRNRIRIICVSRLEDQKRIQDLLESFKNASHAIPNLELIVLGKGRLEGPLKAWVANNNLQNSIYFLGSVANVALEMSHADIFVHPSSYEGFGLVYLEALASGLPIITTTQATSIEILGNELFWPYEIGDAVQLTQLIIKMAEAILKGWSPPLEKYRVKLEEYTPKRCALDTVVFYETCFNDKY